ncbi:MAG: hypothetical protein QHI48_09980 [Bacteroidota bacterium]|nr:hypothetical protein [Bacteroidota bacterium]
MASYTRYLTVAFTAQLNIVALVAAAAFSLVAWTPLPLLIGAVGEAVWLMTAPLIPAFRRGVDARRARVRRLDADAALERAARSLPPDLRARLGDVSARAERIRKKVAETSGVERKLMDRPLERLDVVVDRYAQVLGDIAALQSLLFENPPSEVESRLRSIEAEENVADERMRAIYAQQREILDRRIDKLREAERNLRMLRARADTIEDTLKLMEEQTLVIQDPDAAGTQLNALLQEVDVVGTAIGELREDLATFDRQLLNSLREERSHGGAE